MRKVKLKLREEVFISASLADSFFLRLRGLLGRNVFEFGPLLIKPCSQIHTCFMSTDMDAVYLDKKGTVIRVDSLIRPFKLMPAVKGANQVLELAPGDAEKIGIKEKDVLEVVI